MLQVRGKVRVRPGRKRRGAIRRSLTETRRDADPQGTGVAEGCIFGADVWVDMGGEIIKRGNSQ